MNLKLVVDFARLVVFSSWINTVIQHMVYVIRFSGKRNNTSWNFSSTLEDGNLNISLRKLTLPYHHANTHGWVKGLITKLPEQVHGKCHLINNKQHPVWRSSSTLFTTPHSSSCPGSLARCPCSTKYVQGKERLWRGLWFSEKYLLLPPLGYFPPLKIEDKISRTLILINIYERSVVYYHALSG